MFSVCNAYEHGVLFQTMNIKLWKPGKRIHSMSDDDTIEISQLSDSSPECRTKSFFVTPAKYWPKDSEAKDEFIRNHKQSLQYVDSRPKREKSLFFFFFLSVEKSTANIFDGVKADAHLVRNVFIYTWIKMVNQFN